MKASRAYVAPLACLLTTVAPPPVPAQTSASIERYPVPELPATTTRAADGTIVVRAVRLDAPPTLDGALDVFPDLPKHMIVDPSQGRRISEARFLEENPKWKMVYKDRSATIYSRDRSVWAPRKNKRPFLERPMRDIL